MALSSSQPSVELRAELVGEAGDLAFVLGLVLAHANDLQPAARELGAQGPAAWGTTFARLAERSPKSTSTTFAPQRLERHRAAAADDRLEREVRGGVADQRVVGRRRVGAFARGVARAAMQGDEAEREACDGSGRELGYGNVDVLRNPHEPLPVPRAALLLDAMRARASRVASAQPPSIATEVWGGGRHRGASIAEAPGAKRREPSRWFGELGGLPLECGVSRSEA